MSVVLWNSKEGRERLFESKFNRHFFLLAHLFQPQIKPTFCGIASAVMVLNALRLDKGGIMIESGLSIDKPQSMGGGKMEYRSYSQLTFLNEQTDSIKCRTKIEGFYELDEDFDPGLNLDLLARKLKLHHAKVRIKRAETEQDDNAFGQQFEHDLRAFLNDRDVFIIANFFGKDLGKNVGGAFLAGRCLSSCQPILSRDGCSRP